jgi:hypothetical protein
VRDRDLEPTTAPKLILERRSLGGAKLPAAAARVALEVGVLGIGPDVVLLTPVRTVAMDDETQVFEGVQRPIDRRRRDVRILGATSFDELASGDVTASFTEDLEDRPTLRRPTHPPLAELLANPFRFEER